MKTFTDFLVENSVGEYGSEGYPTQEELRGWLKWINNFCDTGNVALMDTIYKAVVSKYPKASIENYRRQVG